MLHRLLAVALTALIAAQLLPVPALASFVNDAGTAIQPGETLFADRKLVSETEYKLAEGVTEYVAQSNNAAGNDQNIDYFCEVDLNRASIMAGYGGMDQFLSGGAFSYQMATVSQQVRSAQSYFDNSPVYKGYRIVSAINGDYYNMGNGKPSGVLIINGVEYNPHSGSYYFAITNENKAIISNAAEDLKTAEQAIAGGTLLVQNGEVKMKDDSSRNVTYTAVGIKKDGTVVTFVAHGQSYPVSCGYNQHEVAELMKARGCDIALLLDGSGSSTYVSRHQGESEVSTRNSPSDGQDRMVSDSLFIISAAESDGQFDHAELSPRDTLYTPGSTVSLEAIGSDASGGPAPLPADGLNWTLEDGDFGTIEEIKSNKDGVFAGKFVSNGTPGEVTIYLNRDGDKIGSTTVSVVEPDEIRFASKDGTVSIGIGETSDLGLQVRYMNRDVLYKAGDLEWDIKPTEYSRKQFVEKLEAWPYDVVYEPITEKDPERMKYLTVGVVDDNKLTVTLEYTGKNSRFPDEDLRPGENIASSVTAIVTISYKKLDESIVSGSITTLAGKERYVAMDFEFKDEQGVPHDDVTILHGKTQDGANDLVGYYDEQGKYNQIARTIVTEDERFKDYDLTCVSYNGGRTAEEADQVGKLSIVKAADGYPVRFGEQSARLDYNFSTVKEEKTDGACFSYNTEVPLDGNPTKIGIWVYVPEGTPNLWLRLRYRDGTGNTSQVDFTGGETGNNLDECADNSWHYFETDISKLAAPVTIPAGQALRVMVTSTLGWTKKGESYPRTDNYGTLYFDNLTYIYGTSDEDTTPPDVYSVTLGESGPKLEDGMTISSDLDVLALYGDSEAADKQNTGISGASLYVDGQLLQDKENGATVIGGGGDSTELRASVKLNQGNHILRLVVRDNYGSETVKTYNVTVDDDAAEPTPIAVAITEDYAILGEKVSVTFTPLVDGVKSLSATVFPPQAYLSSISLNCPDGFVAAPDKADTGKNYTINDVAKTVSFTVTGDGVKGKPMATLEFDVPATVSMDSSFEAYVSSGLVTFSDADTALNTFSTNSIDKLSVPVSAKYTLSSGPMVKGLGETMYFVVTETETGSPAAGVQLYDTSSNTLVGESDEKGIVDVREALASKDSVTVQAKGGDKILSGTLTVTVSSMVQSADGKPMKVWRNASNGADSVNVSWLSSPEKAQEKAYLQIADSEAGVESAQPIEGTCQLTAYYGGAVYVCGAVTDGLKSGTTYYYRVGDGENWSEIKSFTTGYENTGTKMLVFGDLQEQNNTTLSGILKHVDANVGYDLTIQTGDLVDDGGNYTYWSNTLDMFSDLNTPRLFALGNHEKMTTIDASTTLYNQTDDCYSVRYGNVYIATIPYGGGERGLSGALDWLKEDVKKAENENATWKILVTHQPAYYTNVAGGGDSPHQLIPPAVEEAGIDIVLSGHDHSYARTAPLKGGQVDRENGITYFICGAVGEKGYQATDNPEFHFEKLVDGKNFNSVYLTLTTTDTELTVTAYDFTPAKDGETGPAANQIDTFTKTKAPTGEHTEHDFVWDGANRLNCACGYSMSALNFSGPVKYETDGKSGRVCLLNGILQKGENSNGVVAFGEELYHVGEKGFIHDCETVVTATCNTDGFLGVWCKEENKFYQYSTKRRLGHEYDENHVCTREYFDIGVWGYRVCGYVGKDIATLPLKLSYKYGFYTGEAKRPYITITNTRPDGTIYELLNQSTYGDYTAYYDNDIIKIGHHTIRIEAYKDGDCYGSRVETYDIVPNNVKTIQAKKVTKNSVTLYWEASGKEKTGGYTVEYIVYQQEGSAWKRLGVISDTEYTVTGLDAGSYNFRIRPFVTVDGEDFHSTQNSDTLTVEVTGGADFEEGAVITRTYGDGPFTNAYTGGGTVTYASSNEEVASVEKTTGEVTVHHAGQTIITATVDNNAAAQYRLNVDPKPVTVEWSGEETRVYDGKESEITATVKAEDLVDGDTAEVEITGGEEKDVNGEIDPDTQKPKKYTAEVEKITNTQGGEETFSDYKAKAECAQFIYEITPATLEVEWSNDTLIYSGKNQAPTAKPRDPIGDDQVQLSVRGNSEPGTYVATAVSITPNYVVGKDSATCRYSIVMPTLTVIATGESEVTYGFNGTEIVLYGMVENENSNITVRGPGSNQIQVRPNLEEAGTLYIEGVPYTVNTLKLTPRPTDVELKADVPQTSVGEGVAEETEEEVTNALKNSSAENLIAAVAGSADELAKTADTEPSSGNDVTVTVSMYMKAVGYETADGQQSYTVELHPQYITTVDGVESTAQPVPNEQISAPVKVTLVVPSGMELNEKTTYIRHKLDDGNVKYIKPSVSITEKTVTFETARFSEFTVCNDKRSLTVNFNDSEKDMTTTKVFGPADIGKPLTSSTDKWLINGSVYTELTEELLDGYNGQEMKATPYTAPSAGASVTVNRASAVNGSFTVSNRSARPGKTVTVTPKANRGYEVDTVAVTDRNGKEIGVTANADGTYSFVMPERSALPVTVAVTFRCDGGADCLSKGFADVDQSMWYHKGVDFAIENKLMGGKADGVFDPGGITTRAEMVTILYRLEGEPAVTKDVKFEDVPAGQWYSDAVNWAAANKIVDGCGDGRFAPGDTITREQMAVMLYRYADYKGRDMTGLAGLTGYTDADTASDWAVTAVRWAVAQGIIEGTGKTTLNPSGNSTRAEAATILMRFCEKAVK